MSGCWVSSRTTSGASAWTPASASATSGGGGIDREEFERRLADDPERTGSDPDWAVTAEPTAPVEERDVD